MQCAQLERCVNTKHDGALGLHAVNTTHMRANAHHAHQKRLSRSRKSYWCATEHDQANQRTHLTDLLLGLL